MVCLQVDAAGVSSVTFQFCDGYDGSVWVGWVPASLDISHSFRIFDVIENSHKKFLGMYQATPPLRPGQVCAWMFSGWWVHA